MVVADQIFERVDDEPLRFLIMAMKQFDPPQPDAVGRDHVGVVVALGHEDAGFEAGARVAEPALRILRDADLIAGKAHVGLILNAVGDLEHLLEATLGGL